MSSFSLLCCTRTLLAADFKQKSRWSAVWPNMHYGAMYLNYSVGRQLPLKGVNWVTRDSNRLINFSNRYGSVIKDLDVKRNEEELHISLSDIRWNDHRRLFWRCSFCGSRYRKNVSVRVKYHAGCNFCKGRYPSEVLKEQASTLSPSLADSFPKLVEELAVPVVEECGFISEKGSEESDRNSSAEAKKNEVVHNISHLSRTSKFRAEWKCKNCGDLYRASIRSRTGLVEKGQASLHPAIALWSAYCPSCRWTKNMQAVGQKALKKGYFLGFAEEEGEK